MIKQNADAQYGTRKERIAYVKELAKQLGYTPTRADIPEYEMLCIKKHYRVWAQVIQDAGLENSATEHQRQLRKETLDKRLALLARQYGKGNRTADKKEYEFLKKEYIYSTKLIIEGFGVINRNTPKEEIRRYLTELARILGYSPTVAVTRYAKQIMRHYPSWYEALKDAGLEAPNSEHQCNLRTEICDARFRELLKRTYKENRSERFGKQEKAKEEAEIFCL